MRYLLIEFLLIPNRMLINVADKSVIQIANNFSKFRLRNFQTIYILTFINHNNKLPHTSKLFDCLATQ